MLNGTYEEFYASLDTSCNADASIIDAAAVLQFTPDENTPDLLYYQCVTHRNLGWEIRVVDPAVDEGDSTAVGKTATKTKDGSEDGQPKEEMPGSTPSMRGAYTSTSRSGAKTAFQPALSLVLAAVGVWMI